MSYSKEAGRCPRVLILSGRDNWLEAARALNVDVSLIQHPAFLTDFQRALGEDLHVVDHDDHGALVRLAHELHRTKHFDLVVSSYEAWMELAAQISAELGVKGEPVRAVVGSRDKVLFRELLDQHPEIPSVEYRACYDEQDVRAFLADMNGPIIVKPSMGAGSEGVSKVCTPSDVTPAVAWARSAAKWMTDSRGCILCERFIEGDEFSVEVMSFFGTHEVLAITRKDVQGEHCIEVGHSMPAVLPPDVVQQVVSAVQGTLDSIGHVTGPTHTELRLEKGIPRIVETQTRFGGDHIWEMIGEICGVSLPQVTLQTFLGLPLLPRSPRHNAVAIRYLALPAGTVTKVGRVEHLRELKHVLEVHLSVAVGTSCSGVSRNEDRLGFVICSGKDIEDASRKADEVLQMLKQAVVVAAA